MKNIHIILIGCFLCSILTGCKKKEPKPDYSCDCGKYGKNLATFILDKPFTLLPYHDNSDKWGYLNISGKTIIEPVYHYALRFSNERGLVVDNSTGREFAGFLDQDGKMVIPAKYAYLYPYFSKEGVLPLIERTYYKVGFLDRDGNIRIPFQYSMASVFHEGLATVATGSLQGVIDLAGTLVVPMEYNQIDLFSEGLAFSITPTGRHAYINSQNQVVIEGTFTEGGWFVNGLAYVNDPISHRYGYIRPDGSYLVEPVYEGAGCFWEGRAAVKSNGKWGFIDTMGDTVVPFRYDKVASGFSEGLAAVQQGGQWGYIDRQGQIALPMQFAEVDVFACGAALVNYFDGSYGFIDKNGVSIWRSSTGLYLDSSAGVRFLSAVDPLSKEPLAGLPPRNPFLLTPSGR